MASITSRRRKDGSIGYTAQVRIRRNGKLVYQEAQTFDRRRHAKEWAQRRELALNEPGGLEKAKQPKHKVGELIQRYLKDLDDLNELGRTKRASLQHLAKWEIADRDVLTLSVESVVKHGRLRRQAGANPATIAQDIIWLRVVLRSARAMYGLPIDLQVLDDAATQLRAMRLIAKSRRRERRPTLEELQKLRNYFASRDGRAEIPMLDIMEFALVSARRQDEITRIRWTDLVEDNRTVYLDDVKHPRHKTGNRRRFRLLDEGWTIIQRQQRVKEQVFPYNARSISSAWTRACKFLGIQDLRFHDLRHEATSRLFEMGYNLQEVQQFTLHESWSSLEWYTHLRAESVPERERTG